MQRRDQGNPTNLPVAQQVRDGSHIQGVSVSNGNKSHPHQSWRGNPEGIIEKNMQNSNSFHENPNQITDNSNASSHALHKHEENRKADIEKNGVEEPPDDFRGISVCPNSLDLSAGAPVFLRKNVVDGCYRNVDHYLDVQFRLLREDFVGPLRTGISSYRSGVKRRLENVRVYEGVRFVKRETVNEKFCFRVVFDFSKKKKNFKYDNSKKFMFGSLLCFTADQFTTIIFGKVAERKLADLNKGELIVGFDENVSVQFNINYLMAECGVYFEPYFHVLNVLQDLNIWNFPMEKYIIRVDPRAQPPAYLSPKIAYKIGDHQFSPLTDWPLKNVYRLNDSQFAAFKAALTQEFSIIQGPPGTGKTFLGLKIAKTLLENRDIWYNQTPMLVICYTNHALDQFLEGISEFTDRILRVGGQSKNKNLNKFHPANNRRYKRSVFFYEQRDVVQNISTRIRNVAENLKKIELYDSVRAFDVFKEVVPEFTKTWFARASKNEILDWLLAHDEPSTLSDINVDDSEVAQITEATENLQLEDIDENEEMEVQVVSRFEKAAVMAVRCSTPLIMTSSLESRLNYLQHKINELEQIESPTLEQLSAEYEYIIEFFNLENHYYHLTSKLAEGKRRSGTKRKLPPRPDLNNPHNMSSNDRWDLYFYWLEVYKQKLKEKSVSLNMEFRTAFKIYEELRDEESANAMKGVLVVGMTTTSAARLRTSLQSLKSPIVIVEEAAEVLEAHIVASLTEYCQHLILLGDHQQLKPSTANYEVERFYKLGISLFERMVINKIQLHTLNVQHRMKPEISSLIAPTIYPNLENHPSVNKRPPIRGLDDCLFFVYHHHEEADSEGTSKRNLHEVHFLLHLAKYLILNGYKPENITILAAYSGQKFEMQREKMKFAHVLQDVRIEGLDSYQGEECDIILLSLVRSNKENRIGFLSIENRVCVALSRARDGLYIMGNMAQLCHASELWRKIRCTFERQNALGGELKLRCQVHPDQVTYVRDGDDFLEVPKGGCNQKCGYDFPCGHKCTSVCHTQDRNHQTYKCTEKCNKPVCGADPNHLCQKLCYQKCGPCVYLVARLLKCEHLVDLECRIDPDTHPCTVQVPMTLPCGHTTDKPCHCDPQTYRCPHPCEVRVEPCGHACEQTCHARQDPDHLQYKCKEKCSRFREGCSVRGEKHLCRNLCYEECEPCTVLVPKERSVCPHVIKVPCSSDVDQMICEEPCTKILPCGHRCKGKCHEPCGKCQEEVDRVNSTCGHANKVKCCEGLDIKFCSEKCPLLLPCGHPCTKKCNEPCTTDCKEMVDCSIPAPCGHTITQIKCRIASSERWREDPKTLSKYCNYPCSANLKCDHSCSGTCGECHRGRIHKQCGEKCEFPLLCSHLCEFSCSRACAPCARPCTYRCKHTTCSKRCSDFCTPCKEKCLRRCPHQRCTKLCGKICNVPPCKEPCKWILKCGHPCIGYCGDPCPAECLVCDKEELTTPFFGNEDGEDARFVLLNDCGHIFESTGLEDWLQQDRGQIGFKECPRCKTCIRTTQRFSDSIKRAIADVAKVKQDFYGIRSENHRKRIELILKLSLVRTRSHNGILDVYCGQLNDALDLIEQRLQLQDQQINKPELNAMESKLQIIEHVINICTVKSTDALHEVYIPQVKFLMKVLIRGEDFMTDQEVEDIQSELNRLLRTVEFGKIKKAPCFASHLLSINAQVKRTVEQIENYLDNNNATRFRDRDDEIVKELLKDLDWLLASGVEISDQEQRDIAKAMGFREGDWYRCPNGHSYAVRQCGQPVQKAKCLKCATNMGDRKHSLVLGNTGARKMDGLLIITDDDDFDFFDWCY